MSFITIISAFLISGPQQDNLSKIPCSHCHTPSGWRPLATQMVFNHENTNFPLEGRHEFAECIQCHSGDNLQESHQFDKAETTCQTCHMDIHFGFLGSSCGSCHNSQSWEMTNWTKATDHFTFPLEGMHAQLDCAECHGVNLNQITGTLTNDCYSCHVNDFVSAIDNKFHSTNQNCIQCHNTRGWTPADMSHHDLIFPIYSGKHRGEWSSCETECHINPADYTDFSCGLNGVCNEHNQSKMDDEHDDERGYVYESKSCYSCHPSGEDDD